MHTVLIELDKRPDGVLNKSINEYSSHAVTMSMFYQRCAVAVTSTQFISVFLQVIDEEGNIYDQRFLTTQYVPPEPEPEPEEGGDDGGDE